jgi:CrcB protein
MAGQTPASAGDASSAGAVLTVARPAHLSIGNVALVALGGAIGSGLRYAVILALPARFGIPIAIFSVNVVGAFVLGALLELLVEHGIDAGWSRRLRLGLGTGVLGGFTTYSTLATDNVALALIHPALAVGYALGTVVFGGVASLLGIALARHRLRPAFRSRTARLAGRRS